MFKRLFALWLFLFAAACLYAQQNTRTIEGWVIGRDNAPLEGATIAVEGSPLTTLSGEDGHFRIIIPVSAKSLLITNVGYQPFEQPIGSADTYQIALSGEGSSLEDVVVIGYGTRRRVEVTGSVASVKGSDLALTKTPDIRNSMQGRLPGVRVKQQSAEPGSFESILDIRGMGAPLVIVDGVPRDNFQKIDPSEVENISVLKDASAAIYGVRAANGVILVTTKRGKAGKPEFSLSANYGLEQTTRFAEVLNAGQYAELMNEAFVNGGQQPKYSPEEIAKFYAGNDPAYPNENWVGALFNKTAPQQTYNMSLSGGSEKVRYFVSGSYFDQMGLFRSGDLWYKRFNLRASLNAELAPGLQAEVLFSGVKDRKNTPGYGEMWGALKAVYMMAPINQIYANNNPQYLNAIGPNQPVGNVIGDTYEKYKGYKHYLNDQVNTNLSLSYDLPFLAGLQIKGMMTYDITSYDYKGFSKPIQTYYYDHVNDQYLPGNVLGKSSVSQEFSKTIRPLQQLSLNYQGRFAQHKVNALLLYEQQQYQLRALMGGRQLNLPIDQLTAGNIDLTQSVDARETRISNAGVVGRLHYDFSSKYLVDLSFRYDGSSKFSEQKRWGFFPSVSAAWRISEEDFLRENAPFIDDLKLRASYGQLGDDVAANAYQWVVGYNYPGPGYILGGSDVTRGVDFRGTPNPNITWYTSTTQNIGLEASLWNSRLSLEFDLFRRDRRGLLGYRNLSLPGSTGIGLPEENLNSDRTAGFELVLGTTGRAGAVRYTIQGNFTYSSSRVIHQERAESNNQWLNWQQNPSNRFNDIWWGYKYIGQFRSYDEIMQSPLQDNQGNKTLLPGDLKYEDLNGDNIIDDLDIQPIGRGQSTAGNIPPYNYGITVGLQWNGFDLNLLLQGATGHNFYLGEQWREPLRSGNNNVYAAEFDRWRRADLQDPKSEWIPGKFPSTRFNGADNNKRVSDFWLKKGDYLRLKSIDIGYTFAGGTLRKAGISNLRLYANAFNVLTWTKDKDLKEIIDPEARGDYQWGYNYPINKNYNLGAVFTF